MINNISLLFRSNSFDVSSFQTLIVIPSVSCFDIAKHDPIFLFVHDIGVLFESVKMFPSIEVYFVLELYI